MRKLRALSIIAFLVILAACNKEADEPYQELELPVSFKSLVYGDARTRVTGDSWDSGDTIGVYAIKSETSLQEQNIVYNNYSFSTTGTGNFLHDNQPIYYPADGSAIDFIAYYPYKGALTEYNYPIDISEQMDFLYSNNLKNANKDNRDNNLNFDRVLSKLSLVIEPNGETSLEGLVVEVHGIKTKATFSLADGVLTVDDASDGKLALTTAGTATSQSVGCLLLPTAASNSIEVVFKLNNRALFRWTVPHALEEGKSYSYNIKLNEKVTKTTSYMEIPQYTASDTAPNALTAAHMVENSNTWLNGYIGDNTGTNTQRNYTILFDTQHRIPYWVAYPMHPIYLGGASRTNAWNYDPKIPQIHQPDIVNRSYPDGSLDRGHMLASGDRTSSSSINRTTFYATNMVPQNGTMNGGTWGILEGKVRGWCNDARYDTLYVVTGSILPKSGVTYTVDNSNKQIAVPKYMYKALLKQHKQTKEWYSIAFKMENKNTGISYLNSVVSVEELEEETGFTFFPNLEGAASVKKQKSLSPHWN